MSLTHTTRYLASALFALLCFSQIGYGQNTTQTEVRKTTPSCLVIAENTRLQDQYTTDISSLDFTSEDEAKRFFGRITDNRLSYRLDLSSNQVTIQLHRKCAPPTWTASDWNAYINRKLNSL